MCFKHCSYPVPWHSSVLWAGLIHPQVVHLLGLWPVTLSSVRNLIRTQVSVGEFVCRLQGLCLIDIAPKETV